MTGVETVRDFRRLRALVIGDAMLDSYLEGSAARLSSEGPVPVVHKTAERRVPGGAANTAANLRALGADVVFLGVTGRDMAGSFLRAALRAAGVDDRWLVEDATADTLHKLRILADGQYVVRFDEGARRPLPEDIRARLLADLERAYPRCNLVVISDYGYGVACDPLIERLCALRAARPQPLLVDSKELHRFRAAGATVVTPNHLEARLAAGFTVARSLDRADGTELERAGRLLLDKLDTAYVAITMAAEGALLVGRDDPSLHVPAHPVAQANDVGAGDSFAAATALALGAGASIAEAVRIGIDAGGIAVGKRGTAVVHHQELLQRVSLRDYAARPLPSGDDSTADNGEINHVLARLAARLDRDRLAGRTVVFTNGVFDILHAGHVGFLRQAKKLGDVLVVGVNSDRSARRLKGQGRPITGERDRLALVAALEGVDHAVLFDEDDPAACIRTLRPHIHVKGGDYADEALPEAAAVRDVGGCIVILPLIGGASTSAVIERIVAVSSQQSAVSYQLIADG